MSYEGELWCVCKNTCGRPNNTEKESISNKFYSTCGGVFVVSLNDHGGGGRRHLRHQSVMHLKVHAIRNKCKLPWLFLETQQWFFRITAVLQRIRDSLHPANWWKVKEKRRELKRKSTGYCNSERIMPIEKGDLKMMWIIFFGIRTLEI